MTKLEKAEKELKEAEESYNARKADESYARSNATAALNKLNQKQKAFDAEVEAIQQSAPSESGWHRRTRNEPVRASL